MNSDFKKTIPDIALIGSQLDEHSLIIFVTFINHRLSQII